MREIYRAVQEFEADYPRRKFTPDGHLVGSIGKVIAAEALDPELYRGMIVLSASDLTGHLHCRHLTALDLEVATGRPAQAQGLGTQYWNCWPSVARCMRPAMSNTLV